MRTGWTLLGLLGGALALGAATLALALQAAPAVSAPAPPSADAARHLRQLLRQHDPRRARDGRLYRLQADAADLQLVADAAARLAGGSARTRLGDGVLELEASLPLAGRWVNAEARLGDGPQRPRLLRLRVGALVLPQALAEPALAFALAAWDRPRDGARPLSAMLQGARFQPDRAMLVYRWQDDLPRRVAGWIVPPDQLRRLQAQHEALAERLARQRGPLELAALVAPAMALARERSAAGDAAAENRAALLVLTAYATGRPLQRLLPAARGWPPLRPRPVLAGGRIDFPLHFLLSATLAAEAGGPLADALGLAKEVSDARQGSGFSFTDIAANRAGARFGQLAVAAPARLQAAFADPARPPALLPDLAGLPEFMPEAEFVARFGGVGAPAYRAVLADIDARLAALALFR